MSISRIPRLLAGLAISLSALAGTSLAADPPDLVNYQGVLRDADNAPLDGSHNMVFRFWSAETGGDEILIDRHTAAVGAAVHVSGGLFNVQLGGGSVSDGGGPGVYDTLGELFADYSEVWLEIRVGGENLSPRVRVISSPYASNAMHLGGKKGDHFLDKSSTEQSKLGKLILGKSSGTSGAYGLEAYGSTMGGYFQDLNGSGHAYVGYGNRGLSAYGSEAGGYFEDSDGSGYAYVGYGESGISAFGKSSGAYFEDLNSGGYAYVGDGKYGIRAFGSDAGGHFKDSDGSGYADVGDGETGISAFGKSSGGYFEDLNSSGYAYVGDGNYGIRAFGAISGGYFKDTHSSGYAYVGYEDRGIEAYGDDTGGYFRDTIGSGYAFVGTTNFGISAHGDDAGGYFEDTTGTGYAIVGYGNRGIDARGNDMGGIFYDRSHSGSARVAYGDRGIWAKGDFAGGTFSHPDNVTYWADVSTSTHKIKGTGTVSFVQNHPFEKNKVVVYAAPEGDEVATYTRGSARLVGGEARILLSDSFAWVTNPDVGLTAHLTARAPCRGLYVASLTTDEIVVREQDGGTSDALFDYFVFGLRVGFENHAAVQVKDREAFLPPQAASERLFSEHPELKRHSALERFKAMQVALGRSGEIDLGRTAALIAAIDEDRDEIVAAAAAQAEAEDAAPELQPNVVLAPATATPDSVDPATDSVPATADPIEVAAARRDERIWLPVAETVEPGDVLVVDAVRPGLLRRCTSMADPRVIGVAAEGSREAGGGGLEAPMVMMRYASVNADAGYGAIRPGDLLVASPTPGHAMRAIENVSEATIGKAVDALELGRESIRVLLVTR